ITLFELKSRDSYQIRVRRRPTSPPPRAAFGPATHATAASLTLACLALSTASAPASSAQEALAQMNVADGFEVRLVAHEPDIRKPLSLTFDARGRLWVIQYLQYPTPAGLKPVSVDQYLRTKYDRVPEPPPRGPRGADRITICEDFDGSGRPRKFKDFV